MSTEDAVCALNNASDGDVPTEDSDDPDEADQHFLLPSPRASSEGDIEHLQEQVPSAHLRSNDGPQLSHGYQRWHSRLYNKLMKLISTTSNVDKRNARRKHAEDTGDPGFRASAWATIREIFAYSWLNVLLVFVPIGIVTYLTHAHPIIVFTSNALGIIPLSTLLSCGTENVAREMGDTVGALMNISFGNAVELLILTALVNNQIRIVQASLLGSILVNLLLILGTAILAGSVKQREQTYNPANAQSLACLLSLSAFSLLVPTAFHASFSNKDAADKAVLQFSRGSAVTLLLIYMMYLFFQLRSHAYLNVSVLQAVSEEHPRYYHPARWMQDPPSLRNRSSSILTGRLQRGRSADVASERLEPLELSTVTSRDQPELSAGSELEPCAPSTIRLGEPTIRFIEQHAPRGRPLGTASPSLRPRKHSQTTSIPRHTSRHSSRSRLSEDLILHRPRTSSISLLTSDSRHAHLPTVPPSNISRNASLLLLLISSLLIAVNAEYLVFSIDAMASSSPLSSFFIGLIILPIAGNVAEHITAMSVASRGKMDLALGVSIGSSIQIALFVMPLVVIVGWAMDKPMTLYFSLFETVTLVASVFVVNVLILNGRTNYLEGSLLCACYVMTMLGAFLYPKVSERSE